LETLVIAASIDTSEVLAFVTLNTLRLRLQSGKQSTLQTGGLAGTCFLTTAEGERGELVSVTAARVVAVALMPKSSLRCCRSYS